MVFVGRSRLFVLAAATCWIGWGSAVHADWASCQKKPTRDCLLEEAFRGESGPLTGKDRLDVLIRAGALLHPEYLTAADVAEAQRLAPSARENGTSYAYLAIHGLVAANQKQQAIDLVASLAGATQTISINEIVRDLVKADDLGTALALPDRLKPPLDATRLPNARRDIVIAAVKALAEIGKTDQALMLMLDQKLTESETADMEAAMGQAFAKRGDAKLAQRAFDQAEKNLETARHYTIGRGPEMQLRLASIRLLALRGQVDAVNAALEQLRSSPDAADASTFFERIQGYQRLLGTLLETKQPEAALNVAKSITPDAMKDAAFAAIAAWDATNGRIADARAVLSLRSSNAVETTTGALAVAVASAKAGDVASALRLADELRNPSNRRATLLAIAQALPR